jgi:cysteine synthase
MQNVLGGIGNTPLVQLEKVVPAGSARIVAKLEWANPTGSMKDRMAKAAIEAAEASGRLQPGGTVVEYTAGTTGISLAFVCAAKGYGIEIVFSDAFSDEKRRMMRSFGARITDVASESGKINEALVKAMIRTADEISRRPGHWYSDQLNNHDAIAGICRWAKRSGNKRRERTRVRAHGEHGALDSRRNEIAMGARSENSNRRRRARGVGGALGSGRPVRTRLRELA